MGSISPISVDAAVSTPKINNNKTAEAPKQSIAEFRASSDAVVLDASLGTKVNPEDNSGKSDFQALYQALDLTSKEIVDKINEQLKITLPGGVQSLKPEDVTPEATADRIVSGVTAFFDIYAKQKKNLSGDELVDSFISEVTRGVSEGYGDAVKFLEASGAFSVNGVKDGVEKTRSLIDEKLQAFADQKKKDLSGVSSEPDKSKANPAATTISTSISAIA
jgi:hypothetical protein